MSLISKKETILKNFNCQQSGNCCKCPGYVYVEESDISNMAEIKKESVSDFKKNYVQRQKSWQLIASPNFRPNCFLDDNNGCSVYEARPKACRTYPNWPEIWVSDEALLQEMKVCPALKKSVQSIENSDD
ncbi:hypothetical protein DID80_00610 [Candidatus Marinamargulisbacteria bacterium SCGC AAA071-K20]|nr:hypothetical protein DID80_00610 [Candidatus Marinamargulisbacteria bacterium SCGC AAA071-K20]